MQNLILFIFFLITTVASAIQNPTQERETVKRYYYRDSIISMEKWYGDDMKLDSVKTYHNTGQLDEQFYYLKGRYQGISN